MSLPLFLSSQNLTLHLMEPVSRNLTDGGNPTVLSAQSSTSSTLTAERSQGPRLSQLADLCSQVPSSVAVPGSSGSLQSVPSVQGFSRRFVGTRVQTTFRDDALIPQQQGPTRQASSRFQHGFRDAPSQVPRAPSGQYGALVSSFAQYSPASSTCRAYELSRRLSSIYAGVQILTGFTQPGSVVGFTQPQQSPVAEVASVGSPTPISTVDLQA
ncbi:hypothetical protein AOLI_G00227520 [Acnodon oligacanthus]